MISYATAKEIAYAYREIEAAEKLLEEVQQEIDKSGERVDYRGELQRTARNCQLGWPMSENSHRLFTVEPEIAAAVIKAHLVNQNAKLQKLNEVARLELQS